MSRFDFRKNYNLIYMNWGLNYLNDDEIKVMLRKAKNSLAVWRVLIVIWVWKIPPILIQIHAQWDIIVAKEQSGQHHVLAVHTIQILAGEAETSA